MAGRRSDRAGPSPVRKLTMAKKKVARATIPGKKSVRRKKMAGRKKPAIAAPAVKVSTRPAAAPARALPEKNARGLYVPHTPGGLMVGRPTSDPDRAARLQRKADAIGRIFGR